MEKLLEIKNISKSFPGVKALDNVSFDISAGEVHALMGENGAGKSTLMKCLFGIYIEDEGDFYLNGEKVKFNNVLQALNEGIAMVQQELNQATKRNVMDNLWLGRYPMKLGFILDEKKMYDDTKRLLDEFNIDVDPKDTLSKLSVSKRQMIEIIKAVSHEAKVIVFDEPTSSLSDNEVEQLFLIIEKLRKRGVGIIYISHKMEEILRISDRVTILRDGKYISTHQAKNLTMETIIKDMVGRDLENRFPERNHNIGDITLKVENLGAVHNSTINDVSFDLKKGEILGISGLVGAGRSEILELLFGYMTKESGKIYLKDKEINIKNTRDAIKNGLALITEERRENGIFSVLSIEDNLVISNLDKYQEYGVYLQDNKMKVDAIESVRKLRVKTPSIKTKIKSLSGGNQQKVIIGRWLLTNPTILLMDEPTRGIDVGAKYEIYQLMNQLVEEGRSIIMISSEMPELIGMTDRIMVISNGRVAGILNTKETNQEEIMTLSTKFI
ncbi:sugar ABC transporter ATP-binding protein [Haploplasma axanthum]|uniref:Ribose/galactose/methyl galactoside import ATP-binding protein n=1 Tax=Haploplasma axanthum TaxID=29552 RepID=A0A449BBN7_HAPAX|nr:sugar ABC transporter ATP-binding protein [Haploplasma axanthum]VEU79855.1 xylose ABC transporter ATB-binding protein [Haploplasma axanthum]